MKGLTLPLACLAGNKPTDIRLQLLRLDYAPTPLTGKKPVLTNWTQQSEINEVQIAWWSAKWPGATNTGIVTRLTPTLDLDIMNEEAASAAEEIVRAHYSERGRILVRIGQVPKRAIFFKADEPFRKITIPLLASPSGQQLEFLGAGQQCAVHGLHPITGQPFEWVGAPLWEVPRTELPLIGELEARELVDEIAEMLCREFGYRRGHDPLMTARTPHFSGPPVDHAVSRELPKDLYFMVRRKLVPLSETVTKRHWRRLEGMLACVVYGEEHNHNKVLNWAAYSIARDLVSIGILTYESAEKLLTRAAFGYARRDGERAAADTIKSGLRAGLKDAALIHEGSREKVGCARWSQQMMMEADDAESAL
jgi:hypothetical protein